MATLHSQLRRAVITFKPDCDAEELPKAKFEHTQADGNKDKASIPRIDGQSIEALLQSIREFRHVSDAFGWGAGNGAGNKLKTEFRKLTMGNARDDWEASEDGTANSVAGFRNAVRAFKLCYVPSNAKRNQKFYIQNLTKRPNQTVRTFSNRIKALCYLLQEMPGDDHDNLDADDRKEVIFNAMPTEWVSNWISANMDIDNATEVDMIQYMENQELIASATSGSSRKRDEDHNHSSNKRRRKHRDNGKENNNSNGRSRNQNQSNRSNRNKNKRSHSDSRSPQLSPQAECPIHGGHVWADCYDNPRGEKYRWRDQANAARDNNGNGGKRQRRGGYTGPTHGQSHYGQHNPRPQQPGQVFYQQQPMNPLPPPPPPSSAPPQVYYNQGPPPTAPPASAANIPPQPYCASSSQLELFSAEIACFQNPADTSLYCSCWQGEPGPPTSICHSCYTSTSVHIPSPSTPLKPPTFPDDRVPAAIASIGYVHKHPQHRQMFHALFDSGASHTLLHARCLPRGVTPLVLHKSAFETAAGKLTATRVVRLDDICLPKFTRSRNVSSEWAYIFDAPSVPYDIIFGRTFLSQTGITPDFEHGYTRWLDKTIPFKNREFLRTLSQPESLTAALDEFQDDFLRTDPLDALMLDSKYGKVDVQEVADAQSHLTLEQRRSLYTILKARTKLFTGKLGVYKKRKIHLELKKDAKPKHLKAYSVPMTYRDVFKKEILRLVDEGVMARCGVTEWAAPTFSQPKKDMTIRILTDFRYLNTQLVRKEYPLPRIQDILTKRKGYKYFTKLDISMQYYTFELDEESSWLCVTVTPLGKFRYLRLPMGVHMSPDIAQSIMEEIFHDMEETDVYIDDIGIWSDDYDEHIKSVNEALRRLEENGFTVNPLKCEWAVQETDWLGYWLTPDGLKPWAKKVDAILKLQPPTTTTELRSFIGAITFYRDMWRQRSHIMAPLTALAGKQTFLWGTEQQAAFDRIRALIVKDVLLRYPDHNKPFVIEADASDYQLGAVIWQQNAPVAYFSRKLKPAERAYTTMEKELLSIKETLQEFRTMLFGARLLLKTDHKNLTYDNLNSQRVLRWRLLFEEFGARWAYIKGTDNVVADALSRLPRDSSTTITSDAGMAQLLSHLPRTSSEATSSPCKTQSTSTSVSDNPELREIFLLHPQIDFAARPTDYATIRQEQQADPILQALQAQYPAMYPTHRFGGHEIICYQANPNVQMKIYIPNNLLDPLIQWYHLGTNHAGMRRLHDTIASVMYHPNLRKQLEAYVSACQICRQYKTPGRGYGHLPPREANLAPWNEVAVDLIGPWKVKLDNGQEYTFFALTCIDPVTNLVEIQRINSKTSYHVAMVFENLWLARYPRPNRCVHDNGGEFTGYEFQRLLNRMAIHDVPTTSRNPQSNAIVERMHQTVGNALRTHLHGHPAPNQATAQEIIDQALASAMYATRATLHGTLKTSPGAMVFQRDMVMDLPLIADLVAIQNNRQLRINQELMRQNNRRISHDYQPGDQVYKQVDERSKLDPHYHGPYDINRVHTNGTVTMQLNPAVTERINIRRIRPH